MPSLAYSDQALETTVEVLQCTGRSCVLCFGGTAAMEKQNATGSNPAVRVPPKIKIKALEAVKVCNLVAAHILPAQVALSHRT